jgi:hypothetical protein
LKKHMVASAKKDRKRSFDGTTRGPFRQKMIASDPLTAHPGSAAPGWCFGANQYISNSYMEKSESFQSSPKASEGMS